MKPIVSNIFSFALVIIQMFCLGYLFITGPLIMPHPLLLIIEIFALLLGAWSIFFMQRSKLNIFPNVLQDSNLIKKGPYRYVRHPMYLSLLLLSLSLIIFEFSWDRLIIGIALFIDLLIKIQYEERLLKEYFNDYVSYSNNNWKLLPFIY